VKPEEAKEKREKTWTSTGWSPYIIIAFSLFRVVYPKP